MAGHAAFNQLYPPIEDFEIVYNYNDVYTASRTRCGPLIDPATIELRHRIGRGPFGDIWLATLHQTAEGYEEYHEVAVKMLHHVKEGSIRTVLDKLDELFYKSLELKGACWLYGVSVINGRMCIVMKFYEGSVGDKMARLKEGKLPLPDVLRYGIELAQAIMELHSKEIMVLNLKPSNFLLEKNGQSILGDLGVPYVLKGIPLPSSDMTCRLGTPNYMAPEQWEPKTRGPISYETDSWGFACSIVEMLTGTQPWCGMSIDNIYHTVVKKREKPFIPEDLPTEVKKVITGCFEYDFRSRPSMSDILNAFKSSQNAISSVRVHASTGEQVAYGLGAGDWVRLKKEDKKHSPVGILHSIYRDGAVGVGFIGLDTLWKGSYSDLEMAEPHCVGQFVRLRTNVYSPRFEWPRKGDAEWATGRICQILPNGCLVVKFPGRLTFGEESSSFLADPAQVEVVSFQTCPDMVKKYQHLEDFHWAVRPLLIAFGLFTAIKLGSAGMRIGSSKTKKDQKLVSQEETKKDQKLVSHEETKSSYHGKIAVTYGFFV